MLDDYIYNGRATSKGNVCSIQFLDNQSFKDQLLLSDLKKNDTILEENQDELFDLYITPYTQKDPNSERHYKNSLNQDTTVLKWRQKGKNNQESSNRQQLKEISKLKKLICKKDSVIGELTEQLKALTEEIQYLCKRGKSKCSQALGSKIQENHYFTYQGLTTFQWRMNLKKQMQFLQKNNSQLYEELMKIKKQKDHYEREWTKISKQLEQKQNNLKKVEAERTFLKTTSIDLLKSTKNLLNQNKRQVKIVTKMRQILAEKLNVKQVNMQINEKNTKPRKFHENVKIYIPQCIEKNIQTSKKQMNKNKDKFVREIKSCQKQRNKNKSNNSQKQRCLSYQKNMRIFLQ